MQLTPTILLALAGLAFALGCGGADSHGGDTNPAPDATLADVVSAPDSNFTETKITIPGPDNSVTNGVETLDLGAGKTGVFGVSDELSFTVPKGTVSFVVVVMGAPGFMYSLAKMVDPLGDELVVSSGDPTLCTLCKNRVAASEEVAAFLFPNTTTVNIVPGKYVYRVSSIELRGQGGLPKASDFTARVHFYQRQTYPTSGVINLNFHLTGADGITAATFADNEKVKRAIAEFKSVYAQAGITVGEIRVSDADADFQIVDSIMGLDNKLSKLYESTSATTDGIDIFLVSKIEPGIDGQDGGVILGIAGGIPGPPKEHGNGSSGVAVVVTKSHGYNGEFGAVMAHEVGHFLGLFHSSESPWTPDPATGKQIHDPISDTPENDLTNLMFFAGDLFVSDQYAGNKLSTGQSYVLLRNPMLFLEAK